MIPSVLNEEAGRRIAMLTEFMFGKPVYESYKSLCRKVGNDTISYQEFDFWFHRFSHGQLDLSYDRSLDPKPKEISDMPIEIVDNILDHLNPLDRLVVRNVSRDIRALIDNRTTSAKRINFNILPDSCVVSIDDVHTYYKERSDTTFYSSTYDNDYTYEEHVPSYSHCFNSFTNSKERRTFIEGPDSIKSSLIHLAHYLKNPNLKLKALSFEVYDIDDFANWGDVRYCFEKIEWLLQSIKHQIHTKCISVRDVYEYSFLMILKSLKPNVLEDITSMAEGIALEDEGIMGMIVKTEQWKQAKQLSSFGFMVAPVDRISHFEEFSMSWYDENPISGIQLVEVLSESKTFKKAELEFRLWANVDQFLDGLGSLIFRDQEDEYKWYYPIPFTDEFLEFNKWSYSELGIRKTI